MEAAKQRKSWLQSREDYKQERLERIRKAKEAKAVKPEALTMEEIASGGKTLKETRQTKMTQPMPGA